MIVCIQVHDVLHIHILTDDLQRVCDRLVAGPGSLHEARVIPATVLPPHGVQPEQRTAGVTWPREGQLGAGSVRAVGFAFTDQRATFWYGLFETARLWEDDGIH